MSTRSIGIGALYFMLDSPLRCDNGELMMLARVFAVLTFGSVAAVAQPPAGRPPAVPIPSGIRIERDLAFATVGAKELRLDLFLPEKQEGKLPVVVWIFGGAFMQNGRLQQEGGAAWLAIKGYAVAAIEHRLSSDAHFPAQIEDCKAAVRWLRANAAKYGLDPARFGAWGASSGGHLATMLGLTGGVKDLEGESGNLDQSSRVSAVVDFFGPTDFLQMDKAALPGGLKHDPPNSPESLLIGGPIQDNREKAARANPITYITRESPPFLIVHGDRDPLVPCNQSELLFEALRKAGVDATFYKIVSAGHGGPQFQSPVTKAMVLAFFDEHLK
jgi:acetyl esterase/lipase